MLKEIIDRKFNEIFLEYQEANNLDGDISPLEALELERIQEQLEALMSRMYKEEE